MGLGGSVRCLGIVWGVTVVVPFLFEQCQSGSCLRPRRQTVQPATESAWKVESLRHGLGFVDRA